MVHQHRVIGVTLCAAFVSFVAVRVPESRSAATEVWAFTGPWDPASDASLTKHATALDVVVTGWIALDSSSAEPILPSPYPDRVASGPKGPARFAMVTSWHGLSFHPSSVRRLAAHPAQLGRAARRIADASRAAGYRGLVLDFENHEARDLPALLSVVKAITDSAHARGVDRVAIAVPAADTIAYPTRALLAVTDLLLPMLYDQHWTTSAPGAISDPAWVRATLAMRVAGVDPDRVVAGFGTYAYHWPRGKPGEQISYDAAAARASLMRDRETGSLRATLANGDQLWVNDAELVRKLIGVARSLGVQRVSLWRLGQEDPGIWRPGVLR
jgi:spore germination protein YaaH